MSDIALYRKYRPQKFAEVIGQEQVVKVLQGALKQGSVSHAYLFAGSRGTGKTSLARIFARELGTSANDLTEIDAASNRGIDDVRALREAVNTLPFESKYKVYIIDEVHMLTKEAFNALLKTLEEPPAHAIFILATTETDKLPETVVSRCQVFSFRTPSQQVLREVVLRVGKEEGAAVEPAAADLIALLGDGAFRDTLGILQKVLGASSSKKVTVKDVELLTGAPSSSLVNAFVTAIAERDLAKGIKAVSDASAQNIDAKTYLKMILEKLRGVLLLKVSPDMKPAVQAQVSEEDFALLASLAAKPAGAAGSGINSQALVALLEAYDQVGKSSIPSLPLELALMRIIGQDK